MVFLWFTYAIVMKNVNSSTCDCTVLNQQLIDVKLCNQLVPPVAITFLLFQISSRLTWSRGGARGCSTQSQSLYRRRSLPCLCK